MAVINDAFCLGGGSVWIGGSYPWFSDVVTGESSRRGFLEDVFVEVKARSVQEEAGVGGNCVYAAALCLFFATVVSLKIHVMDGWLAQSLDLLFVIARTVITSVGELKDRTPSSIRSVIRQQQPFLNTLVIL